MIRLGTNSDTITLEYDDRVRLMFTPDSSALLDGVGEYIRDSTTVNIIDNDCTCFSFIIIVCNHRFSLCTVLEINFRESKFVLEEGSTGLCSPIVLEFQNNQNPFTVTLSPVSVATAEVKGVGFFIKSDTIPSQSRATAGTIANFEM